MVKNKEIYILLHNIRSTHNVGAIFRTADAAGVSKIFLSGYTPRPVDQFNKPRKEIAKTALGAELSIPWEYSKTPNNIISKMKKIGAQLIAIEQDKHSIDYKKAKIKYPVLFLVGNEVKGLSPELLKKCDVVAEIPMKGEKESLNVSVSFGVALFRMLNI
jgi:23S rRNA (guanosine2251-2'-O)-methyltransferase